MKGRRYIEGLSRKRLIFALKMASENELKKVCVIICLILKGQGVFYDSFASKKLL